MDRKRKITDFFQQANVGKKIFHINPLTPDGHAASFPVFPGAKWQFEIFFRLKIKTCMRSRI